MTHARRTLPLMAALAATVAIGLATPGTARSERHLRLVGSMPARDTVLAAPPASLDLWFSEPPQRRLSRVVLRGPDGAVALGAVAVDRSDPKRLGTKVTGPMPAGKYVISWRTASADGHAIKGDIPFRIVSPAP